MPLICGVHHRNMRDELILTFCGAIRVDQDLSRHIDFYFDPVKYSYVLKPADWAYSTFAKFVKMGYYPETWGSIEPDDLPEIPGWGE